MKSAPAAALALVYELTIVPGWAAAAATMPSYGPLLLAGSEKTRLEPQSPVRTLTPKLRLQLLPPQSGQTVFWTE